MHLLEGFENMMNFENNCASLLIVLPCIWTLVYKMGQYKNKQLHSYILFNVGN
jgi:hypothetical protein